MKKPPKEREAPQRPQAAREVEASAHQAVMLAWRKLQSTPKPGKGERRSLIMAMRAEREQWLLKRKAKGESE